MLTEAEFSLFQSIPDLTDRVDDCDLYEFRDVAEAAYNSQEYTNPHRPHWLRAWDHADRLNEEHYDDHISFRVVRWCGIAFVIEKGTLEKLLKKYV